jgi:alkane 1-monooxygenase
MQRLYKSIKKSYTMKPWNYLLLLFVPALVFTGYALGGWWNFLVPLSCFVVYPMINFLILSPRQGHQSVHRTYSSGAYSTIALVFVPVLIVLSGWSVYTAGNRSLSIVSFTGLALSVGIVNGVLGFTLAHEFIHRFTKKQRAAGYLLLLQNNYMHYAIEHVWGHHVYACTPQDPNTARLGESLYAYLPRAIAGTYVNAWKIERKKLSRTGYKNPLLHSSMLLFGVAQILLMFFIFFMLGKSALLFFLFQNAVAITLLHTINYLQHYGLMREKIANGKFEKLNDHHAWNTGHYNRSLNLFQLESHADHHLHPGRSFDTLLPRDNSPTHPAGYSFMILLSLIPPLWFKIMDKKINSHLLNTHS